MGKGGNYEREVSKILSLWWSDGKDDAIFWRSNASGARFTARKKSEKDTKYQGGDITFTNPEGEPLIKTFNIEAKTGYKKGTKNWDILDIIDSRQGKTVLQEFWEQTVRDAHLTNRIPILIFRRNNRGNCICFNFTLFTQFRELFGDFKDKIRISSFESLVIMSLKDFFEWIPDIRIYLNSNFIKNFGGEIHETETKNVRSRKKEIA